MYRPNPFPSSATGRRLVAAFALLVAGVVAIPSQSLERALHAQGSTPTVLLQPGNLVYTGAFRLPTPAGTGSTPEMNTFGYGGEAMAFDPYRQSLWMTGHDWHDRLAEVSVPTPGTGSLSGLPRASFKTPWIDMTWRGQLGGSAVNMGGILPQANGDLILSAYVYYDANNTQTVSHVRRSASGAISTPVRVGTAGHVGFVSGWMIPIPAEWQAAFGGPAFTGNGSLSIISRTSHGPALSVFDPAPVGTGAAVPATEVVSYPIQHPTLGTCETGVTFNCSASNNRAGMVFPDGTRSVLYFHRVCTSAPVYGGGGWQCQTGRVTRVLAYDANDLVAVKNGQKHPWDVVPYAMWDLGAPLATARLTAAAYDPATRRIFLSQDHGDGSQPLIHVYTVNGATTTTAPAPTSPVPTAPVVDSTQPTITITAPAGGTTITGTVTVAATASDNVGVAGVQFTLDGSNLGPEDIAAPYQAGWTTTNTGNGSHVLRATARDAAGNLSSSSVTVNVNNSSSLPDTLAPSVSLTSPADGAIVSGTVTMTASASDNVGVADVQFTLNGLSLGSPVRAPYQFNWVTTGVGNRSYTLGAVARDAAGNTKAAATRTVTVSNAEPVEDDASGGTDGTVEEDASGWRRSGKESHGEAKPRRNTRTTVDSQTSGGTSNTRTIADGGATPLPDTGAPATGRRALSRRASTSAATTSNTEASTAAAPTIAECQGENPFESSAGLIGVCVDGRWTVMEGLRTWGHVRQRHLSTGASLWVLETDEAVYEVAGGLLETYRVQDLEVLFEGRLRRDVASTVPGAVVIELRQLSVP